MPLTIPTWDSAQLRSTLRNFVSQTDPRAQVLLTAPPDSRAKLQVYTLTLRQVADPGTIMRLAARPSGWVYMALANDIGAAANVSQDGTRIMSLGTSPQIYQAMLAYTAVRRRAELRANNFELSVLRIPGARVEAFWLRLDGGLGDTDFLYPYLTFQPKLPAQSIVNPAGFLASIKDAVQKDIDFYQTDLPKQG